MIYQYNNLVAMTPEERAEELKKVKKIMADLESHKAKLADIGAFLKNYEHAKIISQQSLDETTTIESIIEEIDDYARVQYEQSEANLKTWKTVQKVLKELGIAKAKIIKIKFDK